MSDVEPGKLIDGRHRKDAIHIAVAPVTAKVNLKPGEQVAFDIHSNSEVVKPSKRNKAIGIVDPFLKKMVYKGDRFWMLLMPNTITGLRHHWEHPAFLDEDVEEEEEGYDCGDCA